MGSLSVDLFGDAANDHQHGGEEEQLETWKSAVIDDDRGATSTKTASNVSGGCLRCAVGVLCV